MSHGLFSDSSLNQLDLKRVVDRSASPSLSDTFDDDFVLTDQGHRVGGVWHRVRHLIEEHSQ